MADGVQVEIKAIGTRDLLAAFKELRTDMGPKWLMRAARKGASTMKTIIAASAPEDTGNLRRNIRVRSRKTMNTVRAQVGVSVNPRPKKGEKVSSRNAYYWRFVEEGHRVRSGSRWGPKSTSGQYIRKKSQSGLRGGGYAGPTAGVPAQPFIEPSWRGWRDFGVRLMYEAFEGAIDRAARKQRRSTR